MLHTLHKRHWDAILKPNETEFRKQRSEYDIAFEKLAAYITENVVSKMEIVTMKVLRERYLESTSHRKQRIQHRKVENQDG